MYAEPNDLDRERLVATLDDGWGIAVVSLRYEPVGYGTHHYLVRDRAGTAWFVNVDDLTSKAWLDDDADEAFDELDRALRTAVALRRAGLEFVHAPMEGSDGRVLRHLAGHYGASVYEYVDGRSSDFGEFASDEERRRVLEALGKMHAASDHVPPDLPRRETLEVPFRAQLFGALDDIGSPWDCGPFSEPARDLLGEHAAAVRERFDRYDELARSVDRDGWVVTHGEPHAGNVMRTTDDALVLIDWDTVAIGPPERDLWMVESKSGTDWTSYTASGGSSEPDRDTLELYRLWWGLSEIGDYIQTFRAVHEDDPNTRTAWGELHTYLLGR